MIVRDCAPLFRSLLAQAPVVTVTGPRQSGKTTLARTSCPEKRYATLEDPDTRRYATEDPRAFLADHAAGAVIDEIQRAPELLSYLQRVVDDDPAPGRFVLTGSQQFELMRGISQSLAGRSALMRLLPMSLSEVCRLDPSYAESPLDTVLFRGFYPRIHHRRLDASQALGDYFASYVERDLRALMAVHDLQRFERFVRLCAGRIGQVLNITSLANDAGIAQSTASAWLDLLQTSCVVQLLPPWFTNTTKRLVKSPKLYFVDTGLACWLLNLRHDDQLARDPARGHLFENFVVMEAWKDQVHFGANRPLYFFRDATGNEVDLLIADGAQVHAVEAKSGATVNPDYFVGLRRFADAFGDRLASASLVYGGDAVQSRSDVRVWPWNVLRRRPAA